MSNFCKTYDAEALLNFQKHRKHSRSKWKLHQTCKVGSFYVDVLNQKQINFTVNSCRMLKLSKYLKTFKLHEKKRQKIGTLTAL